MSLLQRVRRFAKRHELWRPDTRLIAAVSGGSDSVAMLRLLRELHDHGELVLDAVAHVNHRIRSDADADEAFCATLAAELNLPFVSTRIDVPARARERRQSVEVAGRIARREFLDAVRRQRGADRIATAHTEDDQAETVLLRLLRGAGQRGVAGIAPRANHRIRPVLCATRAELRAVLMGRGQSWRDDSTNVDLAHPRNRLRHELLPYLERHFNPAARRALVRFADAARADEAWLSRDGAAAAAATLRADRTGVRLDAAAVAALPDAVARRVAHYALVAAGRAQPTGRAVAAVLDVVQGALPKAQLPGLSVEHFSGFVVLVPSRVLRQFRPFQLELSVPGAVTMNAAGWMLEVAGPFDAPVSQSDSANVAQIDAARVGRQLIVRSRRPGDRMRPAGLGGSKKLQDIFVDRKVNRAERDNVPIVTDAGGRIVWVAGHVIGEAFVITRDTKAVLILKLRRI